MGHPSKRMVAGTSCRICGCVRCFGAEFSEPDYLLGLNAVRKYW